MAVDKPWGVQFHAESEVLMEGCAAKELELRVCMWGMTDAGLEVVRAGLD